MPVERNEINRVTLARFKPRPPLCVVKLDEDKQVATFSRGQGIANSDVANAVDDKVWTGDVIEGALNELDRTKLGEEFLAQSLQLGALCGNSTVVGDRADICAETGTRPDSMVGDGFGQCALASRDRSGNPDDRQARIRVRYGSDGGSKTQPRRSRLLMANGEKATAALIGIRVA